MMLNRSSIIGRVDVGDQAPRQARQDARRDAVEVLRSTVGSDHQPPSGRDDLVHRVEEFFLRRILAGDELDIVDQQQVGVPKPLLEADRVVILQRADELDHELFGRHRDHPRAAIVRKECVTDGVQKVGLAAPGAAVDEKRVEADGLRQSQVSGRPSLRPRSPCRR